MQDSSWSVLSELFAQLLAALFGTAVEPPPISFELAAVDRYEGDATACVQGAFGLSRSGVDDVACLAAGGFIAVKALDGTGAERVTNTGLLYQRRAHTPAVADMNGDGRPDLVVLAESPDGRFNATYAPSELAVLLGDGAGGFSPGPSQTLPHTGLELGTGDFDRDGAPDIVVPYGQYSWVPALAATVLLGRSGGQFELKQYRDEAGTPTEEGPEFLDYPRAVSEVLVFDANGDEHADVVFVAAPADGPWKQGDGTLHTLFGDGQGGLRTGPSVGIGLWGWRFSLTAADYDEDGFTDIVVAGVRSRAENEVVELPRILFGLEDGGFSEPVAVLPIEASADLHSVDFDADGHVDLISAGFDGPIYAYAGRGDGSFAAPIGFAVGREPYWLTTLELDGKLEVLAVTARGLERAALPLRAEALGAPRVHSFVVRDFDESHVTVVDFDGDSDSDVVCRLERGALALLNEGGAGFRALEVELVSLADEWIYREAMGDVDGDGLVDFVHHIATGLRVHLQQPDGTWKPLPHIGSANEQPRSIELADANGDALIDIFELGGLPHPLSALAIHVQGADGEFSLLAMTSFEGEVAKIEDADADGCADLWVKVGDRFGIMVADCTGGFTLEHFVAVPRDTSGFEFIDMNHDGRKDFVSVYGVAFASPSGAYEHDVVFAGDSWAVWATDLNGDGLRDVALAGEELVTLAGDERGGLGAPQVALPAATYYDDLRLGDLVGDALPDAFYIDVYTRFFIDRGLRGSLVELTVIENISAR